MASDFGGGMNHEGHEEHEDKDGTEGKLAETTMNSTEVRASRGESQGEFPHRRLLRALRVLRGSTFPLAA